MPPSESNMQYQLKPSHKTLITVENFLASKIIPIGLNFVRFLNIKGGQTAAAKVCRAALLCSDFD